MDTDFRSKVRQVKLNALSAKYRHVQARATLNRQIQNVDFLGLAVPVAYFPLRYFAKGAAYEWWVEAAWTLLAAALVVATIRRMAYRWSDRAQKHSELLGENISLVGHANSLLHEESVSRESFRLFSLLDEKLERDDWRAVGSLSEQERQAAYRAALKELDGDPNVACALCRAPVWKFKPGACQMCGNTPST